MVVYADILVLVNMYIDFFLLLAVKRSLHLGTTGLRLFGASLIGGLSGLIALMPFGKVLQWASLMISAILISFIAFFDGRWRLLLKACGCFFIYSIVLSGGILLLTELFGLKAAVIAGRIYFELSPLLLLIFTVVVYLVSVLLENIRGPRDDSRSLNFTVIETDLGKAEVLMKTDTGSSLREPFSGLPAAVVELDAVISILPPSLMEYLRGGSPGEGMRLIPCSTLNGRGLLPAFKPDRFYLADSGDELNCYVAVTGNRLSSSAWRGLLNPEILSYRR